MTYNISNNSDFLVGWSSWVFSIAKIELKEERLDKQGFEADLSV